MIWALTGVDRNVGKNADNVSLQAGPKEPAVVSLDLEHAGTCLTVERRLCPAGQSLTSNGKTLTKDRDIAARLAAVLGASPDLLLDYVFVAQWGMFDFLSHTEGRRADAFGRLFGLGQAETIYQALTDTRLDAPAPNLEVPRLERRLTELTREENEVADGLQACADLPDPWRETEDIAYQVLARQKEEQKLLANRQRLLDRLNELDQQIVPQEQIVATKQDEVKLVEELLAEQAAEVARCREELARLLPWQREQAQLADLRRRLDALNAGRREEPVRPSAYIEADDEICTEIANLEQERYRLQRFLGTFRTGELPAWETLRA